MRGKPTLTPDRRLSSRIIPARAGQTMTAKKTPHVHADHPRACGANGSLMCLSLLSAGSSPRVRGKLAQRPLAASQHRIIPARAGQTRMCAFPAGRRPDHPRACGANQVHSVFFPSQVGSSPRVRGKPGAGLEISFIRRIIPARAGQTWRADASTTACPDHPRACGANMVWSSSFRSLAGSSPRVRGKQETQLRPRYWGRIIPARAGQTPSSSLGTVPVPDHPRACGANACRVVFARACSGSSPRVRGKHGYSKSYVQTLRIIPARAGQTF